MNSLSLHKEIYKEEAVKKTIQAFASIAVISYTSENGYFVIQFEKCRLDLRKTIDEFENYVLAETIKRTGDLYD